MLIQAFDASPVLQAAGHQITWHRFRSETSVTDEQKARGVSPTATYDDVMTVALIKFAGSTSDRDVWTGAGTIAKQYIEITTRERLGYRDRITWNGQGYMIESSPNPSKITGMWTVVGSRSDD